MLIILLTALGVGGSTVLGAIMGFCCKSFAQKHGDWILGFGAGVMLASSAWGLISPALPYGLWFVLPGIFAGAICLHAIDKSLPSMMPVVENGRSKKVALFVLAIALHNLPEGIAAGVGFGGGNLGEALFIAGSIALQNVPEGLVMIGPMLSTGVKPTKAFLIALGTGGIEVVGTFLGYFGVQVASFLLPLALAFAGGTMLYVITDQMIPETHPNDHSRPATYALLMGFCFTLLFV